MSAKGIRTTLVSTPLCLGVVVAFAVLVLLQPHLAWAYDAAPLATGGVVSLSTQKADAGSKADSFKIIYRLNGGKQAEGQVKRITKGKRISVSSLKVPTRKNFRFAGWYLDKKLTKKAKRLKGTASKRGRTVYAKWVRVSYSVVYETNGGKFTNGRTRAVSAKKTVKTSTLKAPTRDGYKFAGWYYDKSLKRKATKLKGKPPASKWTLYAKWKTRTYKIAYKLNGGVLPENAKVSYMTSKGLSSLPKPTRVGYAFIGWYADSGLTEHVTAIPQGTWGKKVFFAKWRKRALVAHKGYHVAEVANSYAAYEAAYEKGFTMVETDVRFTSDDVPILVHDSALTMLVQVDGSEGGESGAGEEGSIEDTPDVQGDPIVDDPSNPGDPSDPDDPDNPDDPADPSDPPEEPVVPEPVVVEKPTTIEAESYTVLQTASIKNKAASGVDGRNYTTFEEFIGLCRDRGLVPNIELKEATEDQVALLVALVDRYGMTERVVWSSFRSNLLYAVAEHNPKAHFQILDDANPSCSSKLMAAKRLEAGGGDAIIGISSKMLKDQRSKYIKRCKAAGIALGIWGLRNETQVSGLNKYYAAFSVDAISAEHVPDVI